MSVQHAVTVRLAHPLTEGEAEPIKEVVLRRPTVGALRGLQLAMIMMQDVNALCRLLPRVTPLSPEQVEALHPQDFVELSNRVLLFFVTAEQLSMLPPMA